MKMLKVGGWFAALFTLVACGSSSSGANTSAGGASSGASAGGATTGGGTSTAGGASNAGGMGGSAGSLAMGGSTSVAGSSGMGAGAGAGGASPSGPGLHVVGSHFEDNGKTVRLIGWNRPGGEYSCIGNKPSAFDGPTDAGSIQAMQAWKGFNTVRLPLNETCWLGINGVNAAASGANYIKAVSDYVSLFRAQGIYVIVEMHWNAPGTSIAKSQMPMADADHAADFWTGVANQFKGDLGVVFDLYNEPHLDSVAKDSFVAGPDSPDAWSCWLNGGCSLAPQTWEQQTGAYKVAGMQAMLDAVRATGAKNVVLAGGLSWAGDLSGWAAHAPHDSASNLAAAGHVYYKPELCMGAACYSTLQSFAQAGQLPLVTGEVGEFDCMHSFIDTFMGWADTSGVSYLAWSWSLEPCGSPGPSYSAGPSLISDWQGTPTVYGQGFKDHLSTLAP